MENNEEIRKAFAQKIVSIQPTGLNVFGGGVPGVGGSTMSNRGGSTEADTIRQLNLETHKLLKMLAENGDQEEIASQKQTVLAQLQTCAVLGIITKERIDSLINDLESLK